jgi:hypothetical protein
MEGKLGRASKKCRKKAEQGKNEGNIQSREQWREQTKQGRNGGNRTEQATM